MKKLLLPLIIVLMTVLTACGPSSPTEAELRAMIIGTYCAEDYKLTIRDSTYTNMKIQMGPAAGTPYIESCKGKYSLVQEEERWMIRFAKDPRPKSIHSCEKEFSLWTKKDGFIIGTESITLRDLFDNTPVILGTCEEL